VSNQGNKNPVIGLKKGYNNLKIPWNYPSRFAYYGRENKQQHWVLPEYKKNLLLNPHPYVSCRCIRNAERRKIRNLPVL
jgi:hypothetical protein